MAALRPIFYDTETTGTRPDKDRILELAAYDPVRDRSFQQLIHPGCPIPSEATAIHHISNEMVAGCPDFSNAARSFLAFCEGSVVLIAHNNDTFDQLFLQHEFTRHQIAMPSWKFFDTLKWARRYRSDLPRHTLQFLREMYGIAANNAHRALDDVMVLHQVYSLMVDDLPIETVLALLNKPRELLHMPFGKYQGQPLKQVPRDYVLWLSASGALDKSENQELKACFKKLGFF